MALLTCKMCGGQLEVTAGMTICKCAYCGTAQTLPQTADLFVLEQMNRANQVRQNCDFDSARAIYENLLGRAAHDAELYWSILLCQYGIEYVDDPRTKKKIPTCHRTQTQSILKHPDYIKAISLADDPQKELYQAEAKYIDKVQRHSLEISNREKPYDIFICYKETDESGERTPDSVEAQNLYDALTAAHFRVFFSRITLEDKLGQEYEPIIFAALNSAKVMIVVGTKPEYFQAVWVRNEWSRFLERMRKDRTKTLIPAYKDMKPEDLPEEFSGCQGQNLSAIGAKQDLVRNIRKLVQPAGNSQLKLAFMELSKGEWERAKTFSDEVLKEDPECGQAYLCRTLAAVHVKGMDQLSGSNIPLASIPDFQSACEYCDAEIAALLKETEKQVLYRLLRKKESSAKTIPELFSLEQQFRGMGDYKDAPQIADTLREKAQQMQYHEAMELMKQSDQEDPDHYEKAAKLFREIDGFQDAAEQAKLCETKGRALSASVEENYKKAVALSEKQNRKSMEEARSIFVSLGKYADSEEKAEACQKSIEYQQYRSGSVKGGISKVLCILMYPGMPLLVFLAMQVFDYDYPHTLGKFPCYAAMAALLLGHWLWEYWQGRAFGESFKLMQIINILCFLASNFLIICGAYAFYEYVPGFTVTKCVIMCLIFPVAGAIGMYAAFRLGESRN